MTPGVGVAEEPGWQGNPGPGGVKSSGTSSSWLWGFPTWRCQTASSSLGMPSLLQFPGPSGAFLPHPVSSPGEVGGQEPARSAIQCVHEMFHFLILMGPGFRGHRAVS